MGYQPLFDEIHQHVFSLKVPHSETKISLFKVFSDSSGVAPAVSLDKFCADLDRFINLKIIFAVTDKISVGPWLEGAEENLLGDVRGTLGGKSFERLAAEIVKHIDREVGAVLEGHSLVFGNPQRI